MKHLITYTPLEVERYFALRRCPVCRGELDIEGIDTTDLGAFVASCAWCPSIDDHYRVEVEYRDPKKLALASEHITLLDAEYQYGISIEHARFTTLGPAMTHIAIKDLNSDKMTDLHYVGQAFKLSRFNPKKVIAEIKTLALFS